MAKLTAAHQALLASRPDLAARMTTGKAGCCDWASILTALQTALVEAPKIIAVLEVILNSIEPLLAAA